MEYVEGLQHNLISILQLVMGTGNQVAFNEEGNIILNVHTKEVLLQSKRKGEIFTLDINPIVGKPSVRKLHLTSTDFGI